MQTEQGRNNQSSRPIIMPELDELEFKAIGEGLGFHQQEERPRWHKKMPQQTAPAHQARSNESISREQLGVIYQSKTKLDGKNKSEDKSKKTLKAAGLPERVTAQIVDTIIITFAVAATLAAMLFLAQVPFTQSLQLLTSIDIAPVVMILWLFVYISYFTILETRQTPGKSLMRLYVVDMNDERLNLSRSLERTVFRTLSWLALGFPLLMNFHGRLSRSKVVKA